MKIWKFGRNLPLDTFGSERVKFCQWPCFEEKEPFSSLWKNPGKYNATDYKN